MATQALIPAEPKGGWPIPKEAVELIARAEGCHLRAYLCPAGIWTIGFGTTGRDVVAGLTWTQDQADRAFAADIRGFAERVAALCDRQLTANQHGALTSFAYNLGTTALANSTLLKRHKAKRYKEAAAEFLRWNKAKDASGKLVELAGLTKRRAAESALYLKPD
jgi:lysozyme